MSYFTQNGLSDSRVPRRCCEFSAVVCSDLGAPDRVAEYCELGGVGHDDADQVVLQRLAVDVQLRDKGVQAVDVLDLLECDILALCELHDVLRVVNLMIDSQCLIEKKTIYLDAVDDLETTGAVNFANVPSVQPTLLVNGFPCVLLVYRDVVILLPSQNIELNDTFVVS